MRGLKKINYRNSQACRDCAIRSQCTGNVFRSVSRLENEAVLDIAQSPGILDQRREAVEHPATGRPVGPAKLEVFATWADYKKAGPLLFSLDHRGTRNGDPLHLFFSNVAVKLVGSNSWMDAR